MPFTPPTNGTYLAAFLLPANTTSPDLAGAIRTYRGVYQVSICAPLNAGPGAAEGIAVELTTLFPNNTRIAVTGLTLQTITPVTCAKGAPGGTDYCIPISFQYRADVTP